MKYIESITLYQRVCSAQREYVWKWIAEYVNWKVYEKYMKSMKIMKSI